MEKHRIISHHTHSFYYATIRAFRYFFFKPLLFLIIWDIFDPFGFGGLKLRKITALVLEG